MIRQGVLLLAVLLAVPLLLGIGVGWAQEDEEASATAPTAPMTHMLLGRIAAVEGDVYVLHEDGGETVKFTVTSETVGQGGFKAGDWIIASVFPDGKAFALTALLERQGGTGQQMIGTSAPEGS